MSDSFLPTPWYVNTLYDQTYIRVRLPKEEGFAIDIGPLQVWLHSHYQKERFSSNLLEATLEKEFINPFLEFLGWTTVYQQAYMQQGKYLT